MAFGESAGTGRRGRGGQAWGPWARWWVEPERAEEFAAASDLTRTAWSWRRFTSSARAALAELPADRVLTVRYEDVVQHPEEAARTIGAFFGHAEPPESLRAALAAADPSSIGRWRRALDDEGLADVEREGGALLRELGYEKESRERTAACWSPDCPAAAPAGSARCWRPPARSSTSTSR